jgi:hypothetical protein
MFVDRQKHERSFDASLADVLDAMKGRNGGA